MFLFHVCCSTLEIGTIKMPRNKIHVVANRRDLYIASSALGPITSLSQVGLWIKLETQQTVVFSDIHKYLLFTKIT